MGATLRPVRTLLEGLIDYAGLFPPAQLDMAAAVGNYADYRSSGVAWALGRFIVPAARLDEFEGAAASRLSRDAEGSPWQVSLLGSAEPAHDAELIFSFNERHADAAAGRAVIDTLEVKVSDLAALDRAVRSAPEGVVAYLEIPIDDDPSDFIAALATHEARAKVRTGGVTREAFPAPATLARFIRIAGEQGVPFKATAGLHHPIRAPYPLTYAPGSAVGVMYGYLNLFLAAAFAQGGLSLGEIEAILEEGNPAAFRFDETGVGWRDHHAGLEALTLLRTRVALSFGSCSFTEPVDELRALGLL